MEEDEGGGAKKKKQKAKGWTENSVGFYKSAPYISLCLAVQTAYRKGGTSPGIVLDKFYFHLWTNVVYNGKTLQQGS